MRKLEEAGIIRGYRALLNAPALVTIWSRLHGRPETSVGCQSEGICQADGQLAAGARSLDGVGRIDFLLQCVAENLAGFQDFVIEELTATENVDTVRTMLTIRQVKDVSLIEI